MNITTIIEIGVCGIVLIGLGTVLFILHRSVAHLNASFAKLGYITREDAKKYFGDAADKVVDMNASFTQQYQDMIEKAVKQALKETGQVMEGSIQKAQQDAAAVILKAQQDAQAILQSKQKEAERYFDRMIGNSVEAIQWTLEQYAREHFDVSEHEAIINKLLEVYLNERRPN